MNYFDNENFQIYGTYIVHVHALSFDGIFVDLTLSTAATLMADTMRNYDEDMYLYFTFLHLPLSH